jgi:hypothetical protein
MPVQAAAPELEVLTQLKAAAEAVHRDKTDLSVQPVVLRRPEAANLQQDRVPHVHVATARLAAGQTVATAAVRVLKHISAAQAQETEATAGIHPETMAEAAEAAGILAEAEAVLVPAVRVQEVPGDRLLAIQLLPLQDKVLLIPQMLII